MSACRVVPFRTSPRNKAAIVFIHGGGGDVTNTWGNFPKFLAGARELKGWDVLGVGYRSTLIPIPRWRANPGMNALAGWFSTAAATEPLHRYECLAIVAHSLGGLIVQRALLDDEELVARVGFLFMFGTSSNGFALWLVDLLINQIREIKPDREFISELRPEWKERFIDRRAPFKYWTIAGTEDDFVRTSTSHGPFPKRFWRFVSGDHGSIARPAAPDAQSVRIVIDGITDRKPRAGPLDSALVASEMREFERVIARLERHRNKLDDVGLVTLALAYEGVRRRDDALELLATRKQNQTDALGVLAGRLKRRWLRDRRARDGNSALSLYRKALKGAVAAERWDQAFYHGINVAFMELAKNDNLERAREEARAVLTYCGKSRLDKWRCATEGEAHLLFGDTEKALERYARALACAPVPTPREVESMYFQSMHVASLMHNDLAAGLLERLFTRDDDQADEAPRSVTTSV